MFWMENIRYPLAAAAMAHDWMMEFDHHQGAWDRENRVEKTRCLEALSLKQPNSLTCEDEPEEIGKVKPDKMLGKSLRGAKEKAGKVRWGRRN